MNSRYWLFALLVSGHSVAGVYKCTNADGNTVYQSSPCVEQNQKQAVAINPKTGSSVDLIAQQKQQEQEQSNREQQTQQQLAEQQAKEQQIALLKKQAEDESAQTQALVKNNPQQFSAYAIPRYLPDQLPDTVKAFANRLPDVERLRRLAAQKALAGGQCQRVESDELSAKSSKEQLVFLVGCSSGASLHFSESELVKP